MTLRERLRLFVEANVPDEAPFFDLFWERTERWLAEWDGVNPEHWPIWPRPTDLADGLSFGDPATAFDAVFPQVRIAVRATLKSLATTGQTHPSSDVVKTMASEFLKRVGVPAAYRAAALELSLAAATEASQQGLLVPVHYEIAFAYLDRNLGKWVDDKMFADTPVELDAKLPSQENFNLWLHAPERQYLWTLRPGTPWEQELILNPATANLLIYLVRKSGRLCDRAELEQAVWRDRHQPLQITAANPYNYQDAQIRRLRTENNGVLKPFIDTKRGSGFMFKSGIAYCTIWEVKKTSHPTPPV